MNTIGIDHNLDRARIRKLLAIGLFAAILTGIGDFVPGYGLEESEVVAKLATTTRHGEIEGKTQTHLTEYYNLDMIISVGYKVNSKRGVKFRQWATQVLKDHLLKGYSVNKSLQEVKTQLGTQDDGALGFS